MSSYSRIISSFCDLLLNMWLRIVSPELKTGFCGRYEIPASFAVTTEPESASSVPAMILSSVDLPVPFRPMTAALSPSFKPNVISVKSGSSRPVFESPFIESRFIVKRV